MFRQWVKAIALLVVAGAAQIYVNQFAYAERGYWAIGGEFFVFPVIVIAGYYLLGLAKDRNEKEGDGNAEIINIDQYRRTRKSGERKKSSRG